MVGTEYEDYVMFAFDCYYAEEDKWVMGSQHHALFTNAESLCNETATFSSWGPCGMGVASQGISTGGGGMFCESVKNRIYMCTKNFHIRRCMWLFW